jgi:hypothetical protein
MRSLGSGSGYSSVHGCYVREPTEIRASGRQRGGRATHELQRHLPCVSPERVSFCKHCRHTTRLGSAEACSAVSYNARMPRPGLINQQELLRWANTAIALSRNPVVLAGRALGRDAPRA